MSVESMTVFRYLNKWRTLKAWGRVLNDVEIMVSEREYPKRAGTAWPSEKRIAVYSGGGTARMLKTGLHELSHILHPLDGHGYKWQKTYAAAVMEVTGEYVVSGLDNFREVDEACYLTMRRWWKKQNTNT